MCPCSPGLNYRHTVIMESAYVLPLQGGAKMLNRFELIHIVSMVMLRTKQQGLPDMSPSDAKQLVLEGNSPLFIQRSYTDGTKRRFNILAGGLLSPLDDC